MPLLADIWRVGLAHAPIANLTEPGALERAPITWLDPGPAHTFIADPFGLWRDGRLHLFAEAYDYRTRHGIIDHLLLDDAGQVVERRHGAARALAPVLSLRLRGRGRDLDVTGRFPLRSPDLLSRG
jgi:hypothetical protein